MALFSKLCLSWMSIVLVHASVGAQSDDWVANWRFDEGQGSILHDDSPTEIHGQVFGAEWTDGVLGGGLEFDSGPQPGAGDYVGIPGSTGYPADIADLTQGSISVWFKLAPVVGAFVEMPSGSETAQYLRICPLNWSLSLRLSSTRKWC